MPCSKCKKVRSILLGNFSYVVEELFNVPIFKSVEFDRRVQICLSCTRVTWLTKAEFLGYVGKYLKKIVKNIGDLSGLPSLPRHGKDKKRVMFCTACKCPIEAKARIKDEECEFGKWK